MPSTDSTERKRECNLRQIDKYVNAFPELGHRGLSGGTPPPNMSTPDRMMVAAVRVNKCPSKTEMKFDVQRGSMVRPVLVPCVTPSNVGPLGPPNVGKLTGPPEGRHFLRLITREIPALSPAPTPSHCRKVTTRGRPYTVNETRVVAPKFTESERSADADASPNTNTPSGGENVNEHVCQMRRDRGRQRRDRGELLTSIPINRQRGIIGDMIALYRLATYQMACPPANTRRAARRAIGIVTATPITRVEIPELNIVPELYVAKTGQISG